MTFLARRSGGATAQRVHLLPCTRRQRVSSRGVSARVARSDSSRKIADPSRNINADTGNPQTGKLIDEYLFAIPLLIAIAVGFVSLTNVQNVITQTRAADKMRPPADRTEWKKMDSADVYGPCGDAQNSGEALQDLLEGRPCRPSEYNRATPATQAQQQLIE